MHDGGSRAAIAAAERAFGPWRARTAAERAALLESWNALILAHADELAIILPREQSKPLAGAAGEVRFAASFVKWFAEEARRVSGDMIPSPTADWRILVLKESIGVCAVITPWNFPLAMMTSSRVFGPA